MGMNRRRILENNSMPKQVTMKIRIQNSGSAGYPGNRFRKTSVFSSLILFWWVVIACSLLGTPQPSPKTTVVPAASIPPIVSSLTMTVEPSPTESATSIPTLARTQKPTSTSTTIFDACAKVTGMTSEEIKGFLNQIKDFVADNKRTELAGLVYYPIDVYIGETRTAISNADQFIQKYDQIINPQVRDAVKNQKDEELHCGSDGVGLTHGEIWFSGICTDSSCKEYTIYIIAINNYAG
jgi:hypothetical protein